MTWEELEEFLEEGGSGKEIIEIVEELRRDDELLRRLKEESLLMVGASTSGPLPVIDYFLLDNFYRGLTPMPLRIHILSALSCDDTLWRRLKQIGEMYLTAEEYSEDEEGSPPPDVLKEHGVTFSTGEGRISRTYR